MCHECQEAVIGAMTFLGSLSLVWTWIKSKFTRKLPIHNEP